MSTYLRKVAKLVTLSLGQTVAPPDPMYLAQVQLGHKTQHLYNLSVVISLTDSIEIYTTPSRLFSWLDQMPQEYKSWHQDHIACRVIQGSMLEVGSEIECEEYLHGKLHSMRFRMTKVVPNERIEFVIDRMGRGAFQVQAGIDSVIFVAELDIGSDSPIVGPVFDFIFSLFFSNRIEAMRQHMAEEGENLKAILESELPSVVSHDAV